MKVRPLLEVLQATETRLMSVRQLEAEAYYVVVACETSQYPDHTRSLDDIERVLQECLPKDPIAIGHDPWKPDASERDLRHVVFAAERVRRLCRDHCERHGDEALCIVPATYRERMLFVLWHLTVPFVALEFGDARVTMLKWGAH